MTHTNSDEDAAYRGGGRMRNRRTPTYQVRPSIGGRPVLEVIVDRQAGRMTARLSDGMTVTMDVTTARAMWIVIQEVVYQQRSLAPDGPTLSLQCDPGTGRSLTVRRDG